MKLKPILATIALIAATTPALAETPPAVDFRQVNTRIQEVIDQTFRADEVLEGITFRIDPKTADIETLKLDGAFTATAKTSPWAQDEKTVVKLSARSRTEAPAADGRIPAIIQANAGFETQVLKFVRFAAGLGAQKLTPPSDPAELPEFQKLQGVLADLARASALSQVHSDLVELHALALARADDQDKKIIAKIRITPEVVDGETRSIALEYTDAIEFFGVTLKDLAITLDPSTILGGLTASLPMRKSALTSIREDLRKDLLRVQNGETGDLQSTIEGWARMARDLLKNPID